MNNKRYVNEFDRELAVTFSNVNNEIINRINSHEVVDGSLLKSLIELMCLTRLVIGSKTYQDKEIRKQYETGEKILRHFRLYSKFKKQLKQIWNSLSTEKWMRLRDIRLKSVEGLSGSIEKLDLGFMEITIVSSESVYCSCCGRVLTNPISLAHGMGPKCRSGKCKGFVFRDVR